MKIVKSRIGKFVAMLTTLAFITTSTMGCVGGENNSQQNITAVVETDEEDICEDCSELESDVVATLADAFAADEEDYAPGDVPYWIHGVVKACKALAAVKKAGEAIKKANEAYKAWKAADAATKCAKAAWALFEIAGAIALIVLAIDALTAKKAKCGLTPAEQQMLDDLKAGQQKLEQRVKELEAQQACPVPQKDMEQQMQ